MAPSKCMIVAVSAVILLLHPTFIQAKDTSLTWAIQTYAPLTMSCGDTLTLTWQGTHGVILSTSAACPAAFPALTEAGEISSDENFLLLGPVSSSGGTVVFPFIENGVYHFQCQVGKHCNAGMNLAVTVTDCASSAPAPAPGVAAAAPSLAPLAAEAPTSAPTSATTEAKTPKGRYML